MLFLAADTHLTTRVWKGSWRLEGDSFRVFDRFITSVLEHPAESKAVILAGDVFDERKTDGCALDCFKTGIRRLKDAGIQTYHILGNHDRGSVGIAEVQESLPLHHQVREIDGFTVVGIDWHSKTELHKILEEIPACDLLVMHQRIEHLTGYAQASDLSLEDIPKHCKNVLIGDIHTVMAVQTDTGYCMSPGSLHPLKIDEGGPHGYYTLEKDSEPVFVPVLSREIIRETITSEEELEALRQRLDALQPKRGAEAIVEIVHDLNMRARVGEVVSKLLQDGRVKEIFTKPQPLDLLVQQRELSAEEVEKMKLDWDLSLKHALPACVDKKEEPEVFEFLEGLLDLPREADNNNIRAYIQERIACVLPD